MKTPNPNQGLNARKRRILRNLRSQVFDSIHPFRSQRLVDDNDKIFKSRTYREEIVAKTPEELLLARLRGFSLKQLLRRRTQGLHALSRAEANHERAETPAEKGSLYQYVTVANKYLAAVNEEIERRGRKFDATPKSA